MTNSVRASFTEEVIQAGQLMLNRSILGGGGWRKKLEEGISIIKIASAKTEVGESNPCWEMVRCSMSAYEGKSGRKPSWKLSQGQDCEEPEIQVLRNLESILKAPASHQEFRLKRNGVI